MNKYDDLFNEYFHDYKFESEEERESARLLFNQLMDTFKGIEFDKESILNYLEPSILDFPNKKPSLQSTENVEELIDQYNLNIVDIKIVKTDKNCLVSETWKSEEEGYMMDLTYVLSDFSFSKKDENVKEMIINKLSENNFLDEMGEFLTYLPEDSQLNYYNNLLEEAVECEDYEKAAEYRDIINSLNS